MEEVVVSSKERSTYVFKAIDFKVCHLQLNYGNMNIQNETKTQSCRLLNRPGVLLFQERSAIVAAALELISSLTFIIL